MATDEITFAGKIINLISEESDVEMNAARSRILSDYTWSASFARFDQLFMST